MNFPLENRPEISDDQQQTAQRRLDPLTIVIFGASGDLTARKLIPSLYDLYQYGYLDKPFRIVGSARTEMSDEAFRKHLRDAVERSDEDDMSSWDEFARNITYKTVSYDNAQQFESLAEHLRDIDEKAGTEGNRIHYFALPPSVYDLVAEKLAEVGLAAENSNGNGWTRVVIEKPFGQDLETARELNSQLAKNYDEHQIYRIDHYLAKEAVQNVLTFRLANAIFEPIWNRRYIDHVRITAAETLGIGSRAGYYEDSGILRDMFQNHMMQLLAVVAIEPPSLWKAEHVRDERIKLFRSLRPFPTDESAYENIVLGQYAEGKIDNEQVRAYRDEKNVDPESLTPTYAMMRLFIDNWRWQGVPFYLMSGKRLKKKVTEAVIQFKGVPHSMFRDIEGNELEANSLTIGFQPEEAISLSFQTKMPGPEMRLRPASLRFDYRSDDDQEPIDAYAKVLLDCMSGDHMLFWRQDGIEESWRFIDPVLERCEDCLQRRENLHFYESGTWGPDAAEKLFLKDKMMRKVGH